MIKIFSFKTLLTIGIIFFMLGGGVVTSLLSSGLYCSILRDNERCKSFFYEFGTIILSPQVKIADSVDALMDKEKIESMPQEYRESYISSHRSNIIVGLFSSFFWLIILIKILSILPESQGIGTKFLIFLSAFLIIGIIQSVFGMLLNATGFPIPYFGWYKLMTNKEVLLGTGNFLTRFLQEKTSMLNSTNITQNIPDNITNSSSSI